MTALQDRMRKAGFRRAQWQCAEPRPGPGWPSLTQAETRVARLIGTGYTNKAASETLGISVNTTGTHLRSVFAKLGVRSRVQLTNVMHQEDMAEQLRGHQPRRDARWTTFAGVEGNESDLVEAHVSNRQ